MTRKQINPLLLAGIIGTLVIGLHFFTSLYQAVSGDRNIWWTHQNMRLPLDKTQDHFELYIGGKLLQKHLAEKTIFLAGKDSTYTPVAPQDVAVRLNGRDKVRIIHLTNTTISGFGMGIAIALLAVGLVQQYQAGKKVRDPVPGNGADPRSPTGIMNR